MLKGLNHLTLAVVDLRRSVDFYQRLLGLELHAQWDNGAYFSCGDLWLCLSVDAARQQVASAEKDYTHYAFSIAAQDFPAFVARLEQAETVFWKENRSEGDSCYFLDPDGHQLEIHVGDLAQRLAACRQRPYAGMRFTSDA